MPAALSIAPLLVPLGRRGLALGTASASHNLTLVILPPLSIVVLDAAGLDGVSVLVAAFVISALVLAFARPFNVRANETTAVMAHARRVFGFAFRRSWAAPLAIIGLWVIHWGVIIAYLPQRAQAAGADIGLFFVADGLLVLLMRLPAGWMADRVPASWQVLAGLAFTAVGVLLVLPQPTTPALVVAGALTGAGAALIAVPITLTLTRRSSDADRGSAFALFSVFFSAAIAIGSIGTSPLIDTLGFETILAATLVSIGVAAVITLLDRDMGAVPDGLTDITDSEPIVAGAVEG